MSQNDRVPEPLQVPRSLAVSVLSLRPTQPHPSMCHAECLQHVRQRHPPQTPGALVGAAPGPVLGVRAALFGPPALSLTLDQVRDQRGLVFRDVLGHVTSQSLRRACAATVHTGMVPAQSPMPSETGRRDPCMAASEWVGVLCCDCISCSLSRANSYGFRLHW